MKSYQKWIAVGKVGNTAPEIRMSSGGRKAAEFLLGTGRVWRDGAGDLQEKNEWHRVKVWDAPRGAQLATLAERSIRPGMQIMVEGRVEYRSYPDRDTGRDVWVTEIVATEILLLGKRPEPFDTLRAGMSPEAQAGARARTDEMLEELEDST